MKFKMNKKGVFGLTSVQAFFAIILGIALLAYVIVVIMGTLTNSSLLPSGSKSGSTTNESGSITSTGYQLATYNRPGYQPTLVRVINGTSNKDIASGNWTLAGDTIKNSSGTGSVEWQYVNFTYTYVYDSDFRKGTDNILVNTSGGVSGFFGNVSPVYAILAILVIILVLIVLVRVVTSSTGGSLTGRYVEPQL